MSPCSSSHSLTSRLRSILQVPSSQTREKISPSQSGGVGHIRLLKAISLFARSASAAEKACVGHGVQGSNLARPQSESLVHDVSYALLSTVQFNRLLKIMMAKNT